MATAKNTPAPDALEAAQAEVKGSPLGSITIDDATFDIEKMPPTLLLSEMARVGSGDPEAMGVIAEFFEVTLGGSYIAFKRAVYRSADSDTTLNKAMQDILERTIGRPTE